MPTRIAGLNEERGTVIETIKGKRQAKPIPDICDDFRLQVLAPGPGGGCKLGYLL